MNLELASIYLRELIDELFKKLVSTGIKYIIVNGYSKLGNSIRFSSNKVDIVKKNTLYDITVALSNGKGIYLSRIRNLDINLEDYIKNLLSSFNKISAEVPYSPPEAIRELYDVIPGAYDEKILDIERSSEIVGNILNGIKDSFRVSGTLHLNVVKHILKSSYGCEGEYKFSTFNLNVHAFRDKDISITFNQVGNSLNGINTDKVIFELESSLDNISYFNKIEAGIYTVVFSPLAFAGIINHIGEMFSGEYIYNNISPFSDKLGAKISNIDIDLYDDPREPDNPHPLLFDEEGVPRDKTFFIENGVIKSYALNGLYADLLKMKSTGHAGILHPYPKSLIFRSYESFSSLDELLKDVSEAIFINNLGHTKFSNYKEGVFSTLQRDIGFFIKKGDFSDAFKGAIVNLSIDKLFNNLKYLGGDLKWVKPWGVNIPVKTSYVAVENVKVASVG